MSTEEINEVVRLCQEVINSLSTFALKYEDKKSMSIPQSFTFNNQKPEPESIEAFLGWLDLKLAELKKMVEEYDEIEAEELSLDEIETRIKDLREKARQESKKST